MCAQNALDIATHVAASQGKDVPDYASAIDALVPIGVTWPMVGKRTCAAVKGR